MPETYAYCNAETWLKHNTHGHVVPHVSGLLAKCGGPHVCMTCKVELQLKTLIDDNEKMISLPRLSRDENTWTVEALDFLRKDEGDSVLIPSDNPDFNGLPNIIIDVCGSWTNWKTTRYGGNSLLEALSHAVNQRKEIENAK